ncbi:peroxisomal membrane protein PMP22-like [Miscanthus floridulus]|uniref:peroxisomal membrane protein PMP22-like n=1 Tax=Miscanthus floridulus TaxID=154761 RepID=UPI003457CF20
MASAGGAGREGGKGDGGKGDESLARRAWRQYLLQLQQHPLRTKMITAGCLAGVSDSVAQKLSGYQKIEKRRLLLKMLFGFAYGGPFGHFLYKFLDYIFQGKKDTKTIAKKVFLEQVTSSPWNNILFLFYYGYVVERRPLKEVTTRVKKQYPSVQLSAWMFWPIVGWINQQYMPLQFRVIFQSFVACCWGIFMNLRARAMSLKQA